MVGFSNKIVSSKAFHEKVEHYLRLIDIGIKHLNVQSEWVVNEHTGKKKRLSLQSMMFMMIVVE